MIVAGDASSTPGLENSVGSDGADDHGVALAATAAQRSGTSATATPLQLVEQRQNDSGAGHAHRVANGDRPAVDVDDVVGDTQVVHRLTTDGGEGLVELEQIDVLNRQVGLGLSLI